MPAFSLPCPDWELQQLALARASGDHNLAEEMAQHVRVQFFRGLFNALRGVPFLCWADRCLVNYRRGIARRPARAAGGEFPLPDGADPRNDHAAFEQLFDLSSSFGPADCRQIRSWPPRLRVLLLCRALLWPKVPADLWRETTAALGLHSDFPGEGFGELTQSERIDRLAEALGVSESGLSHQWKRSRRRLASLQFVRDLVGA